MLQNYVGQLRRALGDREGRRLQTRGHGYALRVEDGELDVERFERLVREGGDALALDRPADAAARLREALALWRGPPLADVAYEPFAQAEIARLEEQRAVALERRIDADLALGRHADLVAELEALVAQHPLRERLRGQRMLALYRCGRQAEALEAFREARRLLVEEVGVEPGPELRELHEAILRQDAALDARAPAELPRRARRRRPRRRSSGATASWRGCASAGSGRAPGAGALVVVDRRRGIGKTRLAAELAGEVHRAGGAVLYAAGRRRARRPLSPRRAPRAGRDASDAARRRRRRPRASAALAALRDLARELSTAPVLGGGHRRSGLRARLGADDALALGPLDADAVRAIALATRRRRGGRHVPVDELLEASGGVPGRVHEVAGEWARRAGSAPRGRASAPRAAAGRSRAALAPRRSSSGASSTCRPPASAPTGSPGARAPVVCPFKGLAAFDVADAAYFFGRERLVAELVARAVGAPLLGVVGPSGSGKSSVVRAGLLPALAGGVLPGSDDGRSRSSGPASIRCASCTGRGLEPRSARARRAGRRPVRGGLHRLPGRGRARRVHRRARARGRATTRRRSWCSRVRADFYGRCAAYPALSRLLGRQPRARRPDAAATSCAGRSSCPRGAPGCSVEPELVDALVADVEDEPGGAAAALDGAARALAATATDGACGTRAYERTGGVRGAVARLAEDAYGRLDADAAGRRAHGAAAAGRRGPGRRGRAPARRARRARRRRAARTSPRARGAHRPPAADGERQDGRGRPRGAAARVAAAARLARGGRRGPPRAPPPGRRGARLGRARARPRATSTAARDWPSRWSGAPATSTSSTRPSAPSSTRAGPPAERAQRRLRLALAGVAALLALAVAGGARRAPSARSGAQRGARRRGPADRDAGADRKRSRSDLAAVARQGVALDDSPATRGNLLAALLRSPAAIGVVRGEGPSPLNAIDIGADGRTLVVGDNDGTVLFLDAAHPPADRAPLQGGRPHLGGALQPGRHPRRGRRIRPQPGIGLHQLLDARTHRRVRTLATGIERNTAAFVWDVGTPVFSPDSRILVVDFDASGQPAGDRRYARRWDARSGRPLGPLMAITSAPTPSPGIVGFIAKGKRLVTSSAVDNQTVIRDVSTLLPARRFRGGGAAASVSADGRVAALGGPHGSVRLLDLRRGVMHVLGGRQPVPAAAMQFTPDSRTLLIAGKDARFTVWDVDHASAVRTFAGSPGAVSQLAIAPDGRTAYSAGEDGSLIGWDLTGTRWLGRPFRVRPAHPPGVLALSTKGSGFAVPDDDGSVELLDSRSLTRARHLSFGRARSAVRQPLLAAATPDGRTLAAGTRAGQVGFADPRTGQLAGALQGGHVGPVSALAFSPDSRWLVTAGKDRALYVWDARRRKVADHFIDLTLPATSLSVSPGETELAATVVRDNGSGELDIFAMPRLALLAQVREPRGVQTRFSRNGRLLFYADDTGRVWTLDTRDWKSLGPPLVGQAKPGSFALSPDERMLATTSADGTTQLWDTASRVPIGSPLPGLARDPVSAAFVDDGTRLVTLQSNGNGFIWDVEPQSWARRACAVAGRALTRKEWQDALPGRDYAPACAQH